jgi:c-di-GMP-binding flagellar brake protein YcgR
MSDNKKKKKLRSQNRGEKSWMDFRRKVSDVSEDQRQHPRLEFHCAARIPGTKGVFRVTDISMGGVFLELKNTADFEVDQTFNLIMKLPTEYEPVNAKVRVANIRERGLGLRFVGLTQKNQEVIRFCFETFKDTIPLR